MKLIRLNALKWLLTGDSVYIVGTFEQVKAEAIRTIEIEEAEFDFAYSEFLKRDHNVAEIGIAHTVIFTERVEITDSFKEAA